MPNLYIMNNNVFNPPNIYFFHLEKYLLVAQSGTIKRIDLEGRLASLTYAFKSKPLNYLVDVEYDCLMENIYFTDVVEGYIGKISTNSPSHQVLFQGLAFPEGKMKTL